MTLPIVRIGHPGLRTRCSRVSAKQLQDPDFHHFLNEMVKTMRKADGVGLAANQVAVGLNAMTLECRSNRRYPGRHDFPLEIFLNLRIVKYSSRKVSDWEGCLSIPDYRGLVPRSHSVTFEATDVQGRRVRKTVHGFHARVIQHEIDHLHGYLYIDRMKGMRTLMHLDEFDRHFGARLKSLS